MYRCCCKKTRICERHRLFLQLCGKMLFFKLIVELYVAIQSVLLFSRLNYVLKFSFLAFFSFCSHMLDYLWCYRDSSFQEEEEFLYLTAGYTDLPNISRNHLKILGAN